VLTNPNREDDTVSRNASKGFLIVACDHLSDHKAYPFVISRVHRTKDAAIDDLISGMAEWLEFEEMEKGLFASHQTEARQQLEHDRSLKLLMEGDEHSVYRLIEVEMPS
jgi:hypothetical protein